MQIFAYVDGAVSPFSLSVWYAGCSSGMLIEVNWLLLRGETDSLYSHRHQGQRSSVEGDLMLQMDAATEVRKTELDPKAVSAVSAPIVLCVDDEPTQLYTRALVLQFAGYRVLTARTASTALDLFGKSQVDLVLTDHLLPGTPGTQLAAELKKLKPHVPVVIFSGVAEMPEDVEVAALFISKTEHPEQWLAKIANLLQRKAPPQ
jgi:CheY-like chemotaxis protein